MFMNLFDKVYYIISSHQGVLSILYFIKLLRKGLASKNFMYLTKSLTVNQSQFSYFP